MTWISGKVAPLGTPDLQPKTTAPVLSASQAAGAGSFKDNYLVQEVFPFPSALHTFLQGHQPHQFHSSQLAKKHQNIDIQGEERDQKALDKPDKRRSLQGSSWNLKRGTKLGDPDSVLPAAVPHPNFGSHWYHLEFL